MSIVFLLMQVLGDPVRRMLPIGTSEERVAELRTALGLDVPLWQQFWDFATGAFTGDFGQSLWLGTPAFPAAVSAIPHTLAIVVPACLIGVAAGGVVGLAAGRRQGSRFDRIVMGCNYVLISIAEFWLALVLVYLFAVQFGLVATSGYGLDFRHLALPILVLATHPFAHTAQVMRASVIQESAAAYVTTARARGLSESAIARRHVLPNAALPVAALAFYDLSRLFIAGTVVEVVFAWPGLGRLAVGALERGDIRLVEATVFLAAVIVCIFNLLGDLVAHRLDPRIRATSGR